MGGPQIGVFFVFSNCSGMAHATDSGETKTRLLQITRSKNVSIL